MKINFLCIIPNVKKKSQVYYTACQKYGSHTRHYTSSKAFGPLLVLLHEPLQPSAVEITNFL